MNIYWLEQIEAQVPPQDRWLSPAETDLLATMKFAKRRADWRLGRWTAKNAVAQCLGVPLAMQTLRQIEIRASLSGAPDVFCEGEPAAISISLSHRNGLGACAAAQSNVALGCDVEFIEPHGPAFVADFFSAEEQSMIAEAPSADSDRLVALVWSAKESALKALREGLRLDTRSVVVTLDDIHFSQPEKWNPLRVCSSNGRHFPGWWNRLGGFVRTMVAVCPSRSPIFLSPASILANRL